MFILTLVAASAFAQEKEEPKFPTVKMSGMIFPTYALDLTDGADMANSFDLGRVYVRADGKLSDRFSTRVTIDADHMKPAVLATGEEVTYDTKYRVFVKHAYVEAKDLGPLKIRAGMVPTPYTTWFDDMWGNRYIAESFAKTVGVLDTADLGVSLLGSHGKGLVDWNLSLVNGEGYGKLELDAGKSVQGRVTVDPLAKMENRELPITGFVAYSGHPSTGGEPTLTYGGGAGFQMPRLFVWAEVLGTNTGATSGFGYSASLNPRLPKYLGVVARYDHWDPDTGAANDGTTKILAGLDKDILEKLSVAVTYERSWADAAPDAPTHGIVVHGQAGF